MERIRNLETFQKVMLIISVLLVLVFSVLYPVVISRVGFEYMDSILVPEQSGGGTVYSGRIGGVEASFVVSADKTVEFHYGGDLYGPYAVVEDPKAVPEDVELGPHMTGVELYENGELLFRGGMYRSDGFILLYDEDGNAVSTGLSISFSGVAYGPDGEPIDPMEPSSAVILDLVYGPELTHKGSYTPWFLGVVLCVMTAVSILYADELFRWSMSFRIRDADRAEPSDWELASRYIAWVLIPIMALVVFYLGLK